MTEPRTEDAANTMAALIGAAMQRHGEMEAVRGFGKMLTYRELDAQSARVAGKLAERGVKQGDVVGLCLPRSAEQIVALFGILRAGAAVVPLDPAYPRDLLTYMLADSAARLVITAEETGASVPAGTEQLAVDEVSGAHAECALSGSPIATLSCEDLCYVLYTSGSTGRPKGVAMPHRAVLNLVDWQRSAMPLQADARVLQFAPLSFDVSFQEIFTTLAEGGTLVLVNDDTRRDPRMLWRLMADENVHRIYVPYVALQALAEHAPENLPVGLRDVITAGEQLRITPQIRGLFARMPNVRLHNHYGPTETHVCTAHTLTRDAAEWPLLPPIGSPISNSEVLILAGHGDASDEGELYVGGACLATGYFRRPDLTAERFVTIEGRRFYRTGDLVRRTANGALEYLGRADDQLKVRGFRIEPGEIEAQLSQHPAVRECAVTARDQRLLAYWVGKPVEPDELRTFLAGRLASSFVPTFFTHLAAIPLTASGKIDRRSLPDPAIPKEVSAEAKPASELEKTIARIWAAVLRLPSVPRDVNFGDLGGTSLHAAEAQAKLGSELNRELPVTQLHEYPTVAALARALEGNSGASVTERAQSRGAAQRAAMSQRANAARRRPQSAAP